MSSRLKTFGFRPGDFPVGSVQSRAAARALVSSIADERNRNWIATLGQLTEVERALSEGLDPVAQYCMVGLYRAALVREQCYEMPLPTLTPEQIRHSRAVQNEVERMRAGKIGYIDTSDSELKRLRLIAEENLRTKRK